MTFRLFRRTLPPAAAPIFPGDLMHGLAGAMFAKRYLEKIETEMKAYFGVKHLFFVSSGKAALTLILTALKSLSSRRRVGIPAYTCFSVPSSVVKAGLDLFLVDVDPTGLDFDYDQLEQRVDDRTLCVIPTHLLGLPSDIDRVRGICQRNGVFVVEDAAQAMGGEYKGGKLGTLGDVSFFSFGRGKQINCGSGGVILTQSDEIARAVQTGYARLSRESFLSGLKNFLEVCGMALLLNPRVYGFPASLSFLGLGETRFYHDFPIHRLGGHRAGLLSNWRNRLEEFKRTRLEASRDYLDHLGPNTMAIQSTVAEKIVYPRLPVLVEHKRAKEELCALSRKRGLGISPLYPTAISDVKELRGRLENGDFPAAKQVAERLVTLPVHPLVTKADRACIAKMINALERSASQESVRSPGQAVREASA